MTPWGLALVGLAALVVAARLPGVETGARDWRSDLDRANKRAARKAARAARGSKPRAPRRARGAGVDCCSASADNWREARDVYTAWRPDRPMSWGEAYAAAFQESKDASLLGDYSKPASRRAVLGKMHAAKLAQWRQCREGCHKAGLAGDPLDEALAGGGASEADFERWPADDGSGGTVWIRSGSPDVVRVVPLGGGWRVDLRVGAGWRSGDVYGSELEADTAARELLDVPF